MGILDGLLESVVGPGLGKLLGQDPQHASLVKNLAGMLTSPDGGGLGGLLGKLQSGGLGSAVSSWISTGANLPVTGEQIRSALPADMLGALAAKLGLDPGQVSQRLAHVLPGLVDHLTPTGNLPPEGALQSSLTGLAQALPTEGPT